MTKKTINLISVIAIIIFVICILHFTISIAFSIKAGKNNAKFIFDEIKNYVSNLQETDFSNSYFDVNLDSVIRDFDELQGLIIESPEQRLYEYSKNLNNNSTVSVMSSSVPFLNGTALVTANIIILSSNNIFNIALRTFIIILICTIAVFLVLLFIHQKEKKGIFYFSDDIEEDDEEEAKEDSFNDELNTNNSEENISFKIENESNPFSSTNEEEYLKEEIFEEISETNQEDNNIETKNQDDIQKSLFTGFIKDEYITDILNSDLKNASKSEQDLSIIILRLKKLQHSDSLTKKILPSLKNIFKDAKDIFEFGEDGYLIILNNHDIMASISFAEKMFDDFYPDYKKLNIENEIGIGVSSKCQRLVSAERIMNEASHAAERAFEEPDLPIIAFKVNPDKYNQFIMEK